MKNLTTKKIAYFVSPHGFGHASRASAVISSLQEIDPGINFDIFTAIPEWFFRNSIQGDFEYHLLKTDIGLIQTTPLKADIPETTKQLDDFLPFDMKKMEKTSSLLKANGCGLVICDIAPMGIAFAENAGIPSLLVENFTWDWLYQQYVPENPGIIPHVKYLKEMLKKMTYHIQTEPVCSPSNSVLRTPPVSRKVRTSPKTIKERLGINKNEKIILITMGGVKEEIPFIDRLENLKNGHFIIPGMNGEMEEYGNNIILLPHQSEFFHPDLVNACDVVIGKVGYSTLSEVFHAGVPFGYIARKDFRESEILVSFIKDYMPGIPIEETQFYNGDWLSDLTRLLDMKRLKRETPNGAGQIAEFVHRIICT